MHPEHSGREPWSSSTSLELSQSLYDGGETIHRRDVAEKSLEAARIARSVGLEKATLDVVRAYADALRSQLTLNIQKERSRVVEEKFKSFKSAFEQGTKTQKEYFRFEAEQRRAGLNLAQAERAANTAMDALALAIGDHQGTRYQLSNLPDLK